MCVFLCVRERECVCVRECQSERERERKKECGKSGWKWGDGK